MTPPALIFCAGRNRRYAEIAMAAGFLYGTASDRTPFYPPAFLDLDYRRPNFASHLAACEQWRPRYVVAGDAETAADLPAVLAQAEALVPFAQDVIVVPKTSGLIDAIPDRYVLGLSVPTSFGGTQALFLEYYGRRLHLLGGTPHAQMLLWRYFGAAVVSVDGNAAMKAAQFGSFWRDGGWTGGKGAYPVGPPGTPDLPYLTFAESCRNIAAAWAALTEAEEDVNDARATG